MAAVSAFKDTVFSSSPENSDVFQSYSGRMLRYTMQWAFYESKQYDKINAINYWLSWSKRGNSINNWVAEYKSNRGLYKHIRSIYNPILRLGDFWTQAVWRGSVDSEAQNKGAIPIVTGKKANEAILRAAISKVMAFSNWNANKDVFVLHGAILGDAALYIRDDPDREQSRLEVIHPGRIIEVDLDAMGFVKRYVIEYPRVDNEGDIGTYKEVCEHGEAENEIVFTTYRDDSLYAWDGNIDDAGKPVFQWSVFYGFVPLVITQHKNVGKNWGLCEFHAEDGKISEINDEASLLNDQIRKTINVKWLANWKKPEAALKIKSAVPTLSEHEPEREDTNIIYIDKDTAKLQPFVAPLDIDKVLANISKMLDELEDDLPELKSEVWSGGSGPSDSTILAARGRVEGKVEKRRAGYDTGFIRAVQMAITIGAVNGYPDYKNFTVDSYKTGQLDFSISPRPAFPPQPSEILAEKQAFWKGWGEVKDTVPFKTYARDMGWSDEKIKQAMNDFLELNGEMIPVGGQ